MQLIGKSILAMKKFSFILAALAILGVACNKQETPENTTTPEEDAKEMVRIELKVSVDPETRATMDGKDLKFGVDDIISVLGTSGSTTNIYYLTYESKDPDTGVITFSTTAPANVEIGDYAYYPSDLIVPNGDEPIDPLQILWPDIYWTTSVKLPMMAAIDLTNNTAEFHHLGAILKVNVVNPPAELGFLEFKTSTAFVGRYNVDPDDWSMEIVPSSDNLNCEAVQATSSVNVYYIPIPAGTYTNFQLGMIDSEYVPSGDNFYLKQRTAKNITNGAISPTRGQMVNLGDFTYDVDEIAEWYINGYSTGWNKNKDTRYIKVGENSYQLVAYAQQDGYRIYDGDLKEYVGATQGAWSGALAAYQNDDKVIPFTENKLFYAKLDKVNNVWQFDNTTRIDNWDWCWSSSYTVEFRSSIDSWGAGVALNKYNYNNNMCWSGEVTVPSNEVFNFKFRTKEGPSGTEQWHGKDGLKIIDSKPYGSAEKGNAGNDISLQLTPGTYMLYLDLHEYNFMFVKQPKD